MPEYTALPNEHRGETDLALQLVGMQDRSAHYWFNVGYLPGVPEIDIVLLHAKAGFFAIEVKAVALSAIESFGFDSCTIRGRSPGRSPQGQAYHAATRLRECLQGRVRLPFVVATACWPLITRREWNMAMGEPGVTGEFAQKMLFREDLGAGATVFADRLRHIYKNPPIRLGSDRDFVFDPNVLDALRQNLRVEAQPKPLRSDIERLREIEAKVEREAVQQAPTDAPRRLLYTGHPGTGKTFRLLRIAYRHAIEGRRVLFACFNKVLATDLRRLMSYSPSLRYADGSLEIWDVYDLLISLSQRVTFESIDEKDHDSWAQLVLEEVTASQDGASYDTVLVDEGQDLRDWAFKMVEWLAMPDSTFAVAVGQGQELYGTSAEWLSSYKAHAKVYQLRRNFRNTRPVFRLAQLIYESGTNLTKLSRVAKRFQQHTESNQLEFLREQGNLPEIRYLDDSSLSHYLESEAAFPHVQHETMVREYERILRTELEALGEGEYPIDLLVLVPGTRSMERQWAVGAFDRMKNEYQTLDYTNDGNRRIPASPAQVRLCTYHSARGVEAYRSVVFGLEILPKEFSETLSPEKLAYIALSRSLNELVVAIPRSRARGDVALAVESALALLRGESKAIPGDEPPLPASIEDDETEQPDEWVPYTDQTLKYGDIVRETQLGEGKVVAQIVGEAYTRITIDFTSGTKSILVPPSQLELLQPSKESPQATPCLREVPTDGIQ